MAGLVGQYITAPRFRFIVSVNEFKFNGTDNPVDLSPQQLSNVRGQLMIQGISADNSFTWSFQVQGGIGEFPNSYSRDVVYIGGTNVNCTVTLLTTNRMKVETPVADAGGRVYMFQFFSAESLGPTIQQTSTNVLTDDFTLKIAKTILIPT